LAICSAIHGYLRTTFDLLLVGILVVDNLCGRSGFDWLFDDAGIS